MATKIAASPINDSGITCLKHSLLLFYRRILNIGSSAWVRLLFLGMTHLVAGWGAAWVAVLRLVCRPVYNNWDTAVADTCYDAVVLYKGPWVINILKDLFVMVLPIRVILSEPMRKVDKAVMISCFALGLSVCAIPAVRQGAIPGVRKGALDDLDMQAILTGAIELTVAMAVLELCIGIVSISLPMLRAFYLRWRASPSSSKLSGGGGSPE
ncbi:integral membrane protein [Apiospora marii]|uniref:Integral membrane protein n=1 Tax=Apiospora marii TaxID=335849 RepID=A0ABR1RJ16_9PEZI